MDELLFRFKQFALSIDQTVNCFVSVFVGGGWADETFSARCWRECKTSSNWNAARRVVDALFWFDPQHCFASYISEFERKQLPREYRK